MQDLVIKEKKKDEYWQWIRGICIVAVILIHCKNGISYKNDSINAWNYDYWLIMRQLINFPVAIFIFLSGYFVNIDRMKNDKIEYVISRAKRLLIPFLVWSSFYTIVNVVRADGNVNILNTIIKLFLGRSSAPLYFILVLIQLTIITPFLVKIIENKRLKVLSLLITPLFLITLYSFVILTGKQMPLYQTYFFAWFVFYYLGLYAKINGIKTICKFNSLFPAVCFSLFALFISIGEAYLLNRLGLTAEFSSSQIKISSFLYTFSLINLFIAIKPYFETKHNKVLKVLGDNSFGIYFIHCFWLIVTIYILRYIPAIENVLPVVQLFQLLFAVCASLISILICKKILGKKYSSIVLGF